MRSGLDMRERFLDAQTVGTQDAGFRITRAPGGSSIRVEAWGYWTTGLAESFGRESVAACRTTVRPMRLLWDASALKPQGVDGQQSLRLWMKHLATLDLAGMTMYVENALTKMQLQRLAKECGVETLLQFENIPPEDVR